MKKTSLFLAVTLFAAFVSSNAMAGGTWNEYMRVDKYYSGSWHYYKDTTLSSFSCGGTYDKCWRTYDLPTNNIDAIRVSVQTDTMYYYNDWKNQGIDPVLGQWWWNEWPDQEGYWGDRDNGMHVFRVADSRMYNNLDFPNDWCTPLVKFHYKYNSSSDPLWKRNYSICD